MKLYTKTGDKGTTTLYSGERVSKDDLRTELYGTIDEMQAVLCLTLTFNPHSSILDDITIILKKCFVLSSDFATLINSNKTNFVRISENDVLIIEQLIDNYHSKLPDLKEFIYPTDSKVACFLNLTRTIVRRAERLAVKLSRVESINENALVYLNRLSDYFFIAMRYNMFLESNSSFKQ